MYCKNYKVFVIPIPTLIITQQLLLNILINRIRMHKINPTTYTIKKRVFVISTRTGSIVAPGKNELI